MRESDEHPLTGLLGRATEDLRREPPLRPEWRAELLRRASAQQEQAPAPKPIAVSRRVSLSIPWAIAAGLSCALVGGAVARLALSGATSRAQNVASTSPVARSAPAGTPVAVLPVKFSVVAPNAAHVSIVGDFNEWNPTSLPMKRSPDGRLWEVEVRLPLGRYSYAFLIDGRLAPDPAAPRSAGDDFGTPNSVLMVRGS